MTENMNPEALVSFDFTKTFPHKFWISTWSKDESYPSGFRYKLLSVRNNNSEYIELVIVLEEPGGYKTELKRMDIKESAFDQIASRFLKRFEESYRIEFEEQDFSSAQTFAEYERLTQEMGWKPWT
jgi:hypothetical protein